MATMRLPHDLFFAALGLGLPRAARKARPKDVFFERIIQAFRQRFAAFAVPAQRVVRLPQHFLRSFAAARHSPENLTKRMAWLLEINLPAITLRNPLVCRYTVGLGTGVTTSGASSCTTVSVPSVTVSRIGNVPMAFVFQAHA